MINASNLYQKPLGAPRQFQLRWTNHAEIDAHQHVSVCRLSSDGRLVVGAAEVVLNGFFRRAPTDDVVVELAPPAVAQRVDEHDVVTAVVVAGVNLKNRVLIKHSMLH